MLHHRRQRDRERLSDRGHGQLGLLREPVEDRAPGRVGECGEGAIELGFHIVNHLVKYGLRPANLSSVPHVHHGHLKGRRRLATVGDPGVHAKDEA
jgi:hypothetical protein